MTVNRTKLHLNPLETRDTPAFIVVQSTADSGFSSLRDAINQAKKAYEENEHRASQAFK